MRGDACRLTLRAFYGSLDYPGINSLVLFILSSKLTSIKHKEFLKNLDYCFWFTTLVLTGCSRTP